MLSYNLNFYYTMKKFILIAVSAIVAVSAGIFAYLNSESKTDDLFSANVEALAENEGNDCHYTNGYRAFTKYSGGAYDCCQVWRNYRPKYNTACN